MISPITTDGPQIVVSNTEEFLAAFETLGSTPGGGTILLAEGSDRFDVVMWKTGDNEPVVIRPENPDEPMVSGRFKIRDIDNIRFEGVTFDGSNPAVKALSFQDSNNIQIDNCEFIGPADGPALDPDNKLPAAFTFRDGSQLLFTNNVVDGYMHGLGVTDVTTFVFTGNTIQQIQGDGLRMGGVVDADISGNLFQDFLGGLNKVTHPDMIQIWGTNAGQLTENVQIVENIFLTDNAASQTIFIRNERLHTEFTDNFQNIEISNNLIYNGSINGISLADIDGLILNNNTLLWNEEALVNVNGTSQPPRIIVRDSVNVAEASGNITKGFTLPGTEFDSGNIRFSYDPMDDNYVGNYFVNVTNGGPLSISDLRLLPDSELLGLGADISQPLSRTKEGVEAVLRYEPGKDIHVLTFDAKLSIDEVGYLSDDDYDFTWTFDDGTTLKGIEVTRTFPDSGEYGVTLTVTKGGAVAAEILREFEVMSKDIFEINFETGIEDVSDANAIIGASEAFLVGGRDGGTGLKLGGTNGLTIHRDNPEIESFDNFGLATDLRLDGNTGIFLNFYKVMTGTIQKDGSIRYTMNTTEGSFELTTPGGLVGDGKWHRIGISYDGDKQSLGLFVDGTRVAETAAWGTVDGKGQNMKFGNVFGKSSAQITLDNVVMSKEAFEELPVYAPKETPEPESKSDPELEPVTQTETSSGSETVSKTETKTETETQSVAKSAPKAEIEATSESEDAPDPVKAPALAPDPDPVIEEAVQLEADQPAPAAEAEDSSIFGKLFGAIAKLFGAIARFFGGGDTGSGDSESADDVSGSSDSNDDQSGAAVAMSEVVPGIDPVDAFMPLEDYLVTSNLDAVA